jgi:hypothetical protein
MHNFTTRKSTKTNKITYIFFLSVLWGDMYLYLTLSICSINIFATSYSHHSRIYIFLWLTNQVKILIGQANHRGTDASILSTSEFKYFVEFSLALISWLTKIYYCQFKWLANNYDDASKGCLWLQRGLPSFKGRATIYEWAQNPWYELGLANVSVILLTWEYELPFSCVVCTL